MRTSFAPLVLGLAALPVVASNCSPDNTAPKAAVAPSTGSASGPQAGRNTKDVFSQLLENSWYLRTQDGKAQLYVTELGHGPPVVVLHGGHGNNFHYLVDAIRPHTGKARFVLFDQRGSLMSPVPDAEISDLTAEMLVDDLEHLRQALGEEQLVLFAHSAGSVLALMYFQKYPENVAGLILSAAFPPRTEGGIANWLQGLRGQQRELREREVEIAQAVQVAGLPENPEDDTPKESYMRWRITGQAPITVIDLNRWREATGAGSGVHYNPDVDSAVYNSWPENFDFLDVIRARATPITVIQGDRDFIGPGALEWQELSQECPQVSVTVLPRSAHSAWIDAPDAFREAFREAIRVTRRGAIDGNPVGCPD